jgi:glutathione synthase/RimK-type ligase-like ATP-grasp enzyme
MIRFGMCFSKDFVGDTPLDHIGSKLPTYLRLLELCQSEGWEVYVLTRKTYKGDGIFAGVWKFNGEEVFTRIETPIKIDLVFDWVGNLYFPPKKPDSLKVVNSREFKELTCDKWAAYQKLGEYMPETIWVGEFENTAKYIDRISTDLIVLKPFNGLRGKGIFIGPKEELKDFKPDEPDRKYILQEFVDTSNGVEGITPGKHDLRVVVVNGQVVWCHIRVPKEGTFLANAAQGGNLTEIDYSRVPSSIKNIVEKVAKNFYNDYDNPIFSLDFGIGKDGVPLIFEINDQIGFPRWEMKNRDVFLKALVHNFSSKI